MRRNPRDQLANPRLPMRLRVELVAGHQRAEHPAVAADVGHVLRFAVAIEGRIVRRGPRPIGMVAVPVQAIGDLRHEHRPLQDFQFGVQAAAAHQPHHGERLHVLGRTRGVGSVMAHVGRTAGEELIEVVESTHRRVGGPAEAVEGQGGALGQIERVGHDGLVSLAGVVDTHRIVRGRFLLLRQARRHFAADLSGTDSLATPLRPALRRPPCSETPDEPGRAGPRRVFLCGRHGMNSC